MGPTPTRIPTPTLGMRLSCNFVNVYTRASLTDILARILARKITPRVGQVGEDPRACPARGRSSRGSRRGCLCRCRCPCRSQWIPALQRTRSYDERQSKRAKSAATSQRCAVAVVSQRILKRGATNQRIGPTGQPAAIGPILTDN